MEDPARNLAQELVDHIISFLHNSPADWPTCALVSRSWVYPAQSYIFRHIRFLSAPSVNEGRWAHFEAISATSTHLIPHVRQLDIIDLKVSTKTFMAICNFAFTRLDGVSIRLDSPTPTSTLAVQQLLSLPTLRRLQLSCNSTDLANFSQIWDRCFPSLKHLELSYYPNSLGGVRPTQHPTSSIRLESLALRNASARIWLTHPHCPLDFSGLRALSIHHNTDLLGSQTFALARQTVQTLDLAPEFNTPTLDLSSFATLAVLRIRVTPRSWSWMITTLFTITPSSHILKIVFIGPLAGTSPETFDSILSGLPISPIIELEVNPIVYAGIAPKLPLLRSKNLVGHCLHISLLRDLTQLHSGSCAAPMSIHIGSSALPACFDFQPPHLYRSIFNRFNA
ncbi:hypothetical protein C8R44DRAFT_985189 [Mycena epipterygia]|nr:hypothetical protein C8R44DRAFT_985189 [Mycena epipterygia]